MEAGKDEEGKSRQWRPLKIQPFEKKEEECSPVNSFQNFAGQLISPGSMEYASSSSSDGEQGGLKESFNGSAQPERRSAQEQRKQRLTKQFSNQIYQ